MTKQFTKTIRFALIAGVMVFMLLFTGCAYNVPSASGEPAGTEQTTSPTAATATVFATPIPSLSPSSTISPLPAPTPTLTPATLPPVPKNFIVKDEYWEFASFFYRPDGSPVYGEFYFVGFPEGMTLYAPMSGYVTVTNGTIEGVKHTTIRIAESADGPLEWDSFGPKTGRYSIITARGMELLDVGVKNDAVYVEQGEPFAKITKRAEVYPRMFEEKPELIVGLDMGWMEMLDVSVKDPREFMWLAVQILEEGKED